jgi:hypothetical protein
MRKTSVLLLWVLNLFDALMTWFAIAIGQYAAEANPPMIWAIGKGWAIFFIIKVGIMTIMSWVIYLLYDKPEYNSGRVTVGVMTWILVSLYSLLACWHVFGFVMWHILK